MNSPETATTTKPSLAQDWLSALRYWLRGRNGVIALIGLALVIGVVLNWSWLVAVGVVPLLITVLPCAAMCALGLCMNRMIGGSCSTESNPVGCQSRTDGQRRLLRRASQVRSRSWPRNRHGRMSRSSTRQCL
jgi:hypothetical protein